MRTLSFNHCPGPKVFMSPRVILIVSFSSATFASTSASFPLRFYAEKSEKLENDHIEVMDVFEISLTELFIIDTISSVSSGKPSSSGSSSTIISVRVSFFLIRSSNSFSNVDSLFKTFRVSFSACIRSSLDF